MIIMFDSVKVYICVFKVVNIIIDWLIKVFKKNKNSVLKKKIG